MIYLITGAPGTGKTAHALTLLQGLPQYPDKVVVVGVREYQGKGQYFESIKVDEMNQPFPFESYPGFCFLIDEAQDYWPSRVAGRTAPESLTFLPKHRHIGQDYIITCQFPTQLDVKLRQLVGRHLHLEKEPLGVMVYEAGRCIENVKDFPATSKRPRGGISAETKGMYNSMEGEETALQKSKPRLPLKLWLILGVVAVMMAMAAYFFFRGNNMLNPGKSVTTGGSMISGTALDSTIPKSEKSKEDIKPLRLIKHPSELMAGNSDYPELAPQPRLPVSCVSNGVRCQCYDQAGQRIDNMSTKRCNALLNGDDGLVVAWGRDDTPRLPLYPRPPLPEPKPIEKPLTDKLKTEPKQIDSTGPNAVSVGEAAPRYD